MRKSAKNAASPDRPILLPFPNGWFPVALSRELKAGTVLRRRLAGEDIVVYRTRSGLLRVVRPYCPHIGAHLGFGGLVEQENLTCPFHRFSFDPTGQCVATGYGTPPPKVNLQLRESFETDGVIWVWRHSQNAPPDWAIPAGTSIGYSSPLLQEHTFDSYPQEFVENLHDLGHFGPHHGYAGYQVTAPAEFSGPRYHLGLEVSRSFPLIGATTMRWDVDGYGLGFITARIEVPRYHIRMLGEMLILPVDAGKLHVTSVTRLKRPQLRRISSPRLRSLLQAMAEGAFLQILRPASSWTRRELDQDRIIWQAKTYLDRPRLAKGDGPITAFRRWASHLYSEEVGTAAALDRGRIGPATVGVQTYLRTQRLRTERKVTPRRGWKSGASGRRSVYSVPEPD
jgi:phenylpropionate dioxygenase-like ring-hydroxylating dioxygenase large terminal subunit